MGNTILKPPIIAPSEPGQHDYLVVVCRADTAAALYAICSLVSHLAPMPVWVRTRAHHLAEEFRRLSAGADRIDIVAEGDTLVARQILDYEPALLAGPIANIEYRLRFTRKDGTPLGDGWDEEVTANYTWELVQAVRLANRRLPPGLSNWLFQAEAGDEGALWDEKRQVLCRAKVVKLAPERAHAPQAIKNE